MLFHLWMLYLVLGVTLSASPHQGPRGNIFWNPDDSDDLDVKRNVWSRKAVHEKHPSSIVYPDNFKGNHKQQMNRILFPLDSKEEATTSGYWHLTGTTNSRHYSSGTNIYGTGKHTDSTETREVINVTPKQNYAIGIEDSTSQSPQFLENKVQSFPSGEDAAKIETMPNFIYQEVANGIEHYTQVDSNKPNSSDSFLNHVKINDIHPNSEEVNVQGHSNHEMRDGTNLKLPSAFLVYIPEGIMVPDMKPITKHDLYFNMSDYLPGHQVDHGYFVNIMPAMVAYKPIGMVTLNDSLLQISDSKVTPSTSAKPQTTTTTRLCRPPSDFNDIYVPGGKIISELYCKYRSRRSTRSRISHADLDEFIKEIDKVTSENREHVDDLQSSRTPPKKQKTILGRIRDYLPSFGRKKHTRRSVQMDQHSVRHPMRKFLTKQEHHKAATVDSLNKVHRYRGLAPNNYNSHQIDKKQDRVVRSLSDNQIEENADNSLNNILHFPTFSNEIITPFQAQVLPNSIPISDPNEWNPNIGKISSERHSSMQSSMEHYQYMNGNVPEGQTQTYKEFRKVPNVMHLKQKQSDKFLKLGKFIHLKTNDSGKMSTHLHNDGLGDKYMNELVDFIIYVVNRGIMAKGNSTVNMPDVDQEFEKSVLGLKVHGEFHGKVGWFKNLSSVYRDGDVVVTRPADSTLVVQVPIALRTMEFGFAHYEAMFAGVNTNGKITGTVVSNSMSLTASVTIDSTNKCHVSLESFKISKLGDIEFDITGLGELKWFVNEITSWLSGHYKNIVVDKVQKEIMAEVNSALSHVKCA